MDHIDRKIIDILQADARAPLKEIAEQVFLSSPAVSARISRLEQAGLLRGYQAQVDAPALGYGVKAFINLELDPQRKPEFYPYIESCKNVVECTTSSTGCSSSDAPAPRSSFPPVWNTGVCRWSARRIRRTDAPHHRSLQTGPAGTGPVFCRLFAGKNFLRKSFAGRLTGAGQVYILCI